MMMFVQIYSSVPTSQMSPYRPWPTSCWRGLSILAGLWSTRASSRYITSCVTETRSVPPINHQPSVKTQIVSLFCFQRFTQYLASSNSNFQLANFLDKTGVQGNPGLSQSSFDQTVQRRFMELQLKLFTWTRGLKLITNELKLQVTVGDVSTHQHVCVLSSVVWERGGGLPSTV